MRKLTDGMKARREEARQQVYRLSGLRSYPDNVLAAEHALIDAMITAPSKEAMRQFVDDWLRANDRCPVPKNIYDAFKPLDENWAPKATRCTACGGTGYVIVEAPSGDTGAKRCKCFGGQAVSETNLHETAADSETEEWG